MQTNTGHGLRGGPRSHLFDFSVRLRGGGAGWVALNRVLGAIQKVFENRS